MGLTDASLMILTRVPAGKEFDAAAASAAQSGAMVFREGGAAHVPSRLLPGQTTTAERALVAAECWLQGETEAMVSGLRNQGVEAWVEVTSSSEAERAVSAGAAGLVVCGLEGGGLVSEDSTLILLRRVLKVTPHGTPVVARGGIGPDSAAACVAAGSAGVLLDVQL
ncbi:MAG: hypothetical protein VYE15_08395, partial [Myxococcota bacterium]|nr:hypothetical protein [Myxococcota bacterium]